MHGSGQVDPGTLFFPVMMLTIIEGKTACVVYGKMQGLVRVSNSARDEGLKVVQSEGLKIEYKKLLIRQVGSVPNGTRKGRGERHYSSDAPRV